MHQYTEYVLLTVQNSQIKLCFFSQPFDTTIGCHHAKECFGYQKSGRNFIRKRDHQPCHAIFLGRCYRSVGCQGGTSGNVSTLQEGGGRLVKLPDHMVYFLIEHYRKVAHISLYKYIHTKQSFWLSVPNHMHKQQPKKDQKQPHCDE